MSQALFLSLEELFVSCQTMSGFTLRVELREGRGAVSWLGCLVGYGSCRTGFLKSWDVVHQTELFCWAGRESGMTWRSFMRCRLVYLGALVRSWMRLLGVLWVNQFKALRKQTLCGQDYPECLDSVRGQRDKRGSWLCRSEAVKGSWTS